MLNKYISLIVNKYYKYVLFKQSKSKLNFNFTKNNSLLCKNSSMSKSHPFTFFITCLKKGSYRLVVKHSSKDIAEEVESLLVGFDLSEVRKPESKKYRLGLSKVSKKFGVFEYIKGVKKGNQYVCEIDLSFPRDIDILKMSFFTSLRQLVVLDEIKVLKLNDLRYVNIENIQQDSSSLTLARFHQENLLLKLGAQYNNVDFFIYADVSPNVIDGSSIWLASIIDMLSLQYKVLVIFKDNINPHKNILSNILTQQAILLEPKDFGEEAPFNNSKAVELLKQLDHIIPNVKGVVTRGYDLAYEIQKDQTFLGRRFVYLTDFYQVGKYGFEISEAKHKTLESVLFNSDFLLVQTRAIAEKLQEFSDKKLNIIDIPPSYPSALTNLLEIVDQDASYIHIGYSGKVQPSWGVQDLLEWVEELITNKNIKICIHIVTDKIYSPNKKDNFIENINILLNKPFVKVYTGLNRFSAMGIMKSMDLVWCFRDKVLEESTLEISTKLIEMAALAKPSLCYPSNINKKLLGPSYPYFMNDKQSFYKIIADGGYSSNKNLLDISQKVFDTYTFENIIKNFRTYVPKMSDGDGNNLRVVFAGHDLKFIYPWMSDLKRKHNSVKVDKWEWGAPICDERSKEFLLWADIIFCEWGLANAVWYSQNNKTNKPLFIRIHAQEVRDKAKKFGSRIQLDNVTKLIFVAEHIREKAIKLWNWPRDKTIVIPNYLNTNNFFLNKNPLAVNLGMVGIVPKTKRFDRALDLLEALINEGVDAHLYIKGYRPEELSFMQSPGRKKELIYYESLYEKIDKSKTLKDKVHFEGWGNDISLWYRNKDFILSTSDSESFHYALAEGVMSGCLPIIWPWEHSKHIYPSEWVVDGTDEAVSKILLNLNKSLRCINKIRLENRKILESRYGEKMIFNQLYKLINSSFSDRLKKLKKENFMLIDNQKKIIGIDKLGVLSVKFNVINYEPQNIENSSLVSINFMDKDHKSLMASGDFAINKKLGAYKYLLTGTPDTPGINQIEIDINNEHIRYVELSFLAWKKNSKDYFDQESIEIKFNDFKGASENNIAPSEYFVSQLKPSDRIIILYTTAPYIGHETLELRPNRLAKEYINLGYKVIFFSFSRIPDELVMPFEYGGCLLQCYKDDITNFTSMLLDLTLKEKIFICSSFPDIYAMANIEKLKIARGWKVVYEIRDDMEEFNRVGYSKWYTSQLEIKVAQLVDKIITVSPRLAQKIKVMAGANEEFSRKVRVIQNAAPNKLINDSAYLRSNHYFDIKNKSNIVGYIGHLTQSWFDWTLLISTAKKQPDIIFEVIGHGFPNNLTLPTNIHFLGSKNHEEFLKISERWKVGLIPFIKSPLTFGVDPNKIYEYLAANLLVVTADMGSVRECPATYVYSDPEEFEGMLLEALSVEYNQKLLVEIENYVSHSKWSNRAQSAINFINQIDDKV